MHEQRPGSEYLVDLLLHPWLVLLHEELSEGLSDDAVGLQVPHVVVLFHLDAVGIKPLVRVELDLIRCPLALRLHVSFGLEDLHEELSDIRCVFLNL